MSQITTLTQDIVQRVQSAVTQIFKNKLAHCTSSPLNCSSYKIQSVTRKRVGITSGQK